VANAVSDAGAAAVARPSASSPKDDDARLPDDSLVFFALFLEVQAEAFAPSCAPRALAAKKAQARQRTGGQGPPSRVDEDGPSSRDMDADEGTTRKERRRIF
jgi:hypothetical protein